MAVIDGYALDEGISPADGSLGYGAGGYGFDPNGDLFPGDGAMAYGAGGYGLDIDPIISTVYRMRAYDSTLARFVYWNATTIDASGDSYGGPGPLSDVVVFRLLGS